MDLGVLTRGTTAIVGSEPSDREARCVGVELPDSTEMQSGELVRLILQADSAHRQLDGYLTSLLGRLGDLEGQDAVEELCRQFGLGRYRAHQQAKTANALNALPTTLDAAKQGWISIDHARVLSESHQRAPLSTEQELALITAAITEDLDVFKKTVARGEDQRRADDGLTRHERQRERRTGKVFDGDDEMVVLHAELDRVAGERVKISLYALTDRMFREDAKTNSDRTHEQRTADALVALITQRPARSDESRGKSHADCCDTNDDNDSCDSDSHGDRSGKSSFDRLECGDLTPQPTTLIVTVDYDTLSDQLKNAGLLDGTPIGIDELRHIACDAGIIPAIFAADGQPLYMGRKQRAATAAQKLALYVRDRRCIGCGMRASACDAHHIIWWDHNGTTDMPNLVLLCPKCHKKVHKQGYVIVRDPKGQFQLRPPSKPKTRSPDRRAKPGQTTAGDSAGLLIAS
ncbi:MAG: DUF222 domain-containing protein [Acidimicrobiia bacterium]|nr:DUF222 domain-containing protein [Acidimicrobiia bacterium]MYE73580.1 DUF222 domain-containing protein [Acidimicrobiia bacterium]MYJ62327.1 DUF222 domain-containing protein [Acidimicrobiia bacterium]